MVVPGHLTCLPRNLYAGQEAVVRTRRETTTGSQLRKEYSDLVHWEDLEGSGGEGGGRGERDGEHM